jgi:hypothetical protein
MKRLKIALGPAIAAGLMAVVASPAMALPRWVHCVKDPTGSYHDSDCRVPASEGTGDWETKELVGTSEVTSSGELTLEDSEATGGPVDVVCKVRGTGWVANLSSGSGETIFHTMASIGCKFGSHGECEESAGATATPRNLPWAGRLEERVGEVRDEIVSGGRKEEGNGEPGWSVQCRVAKVFEIEDTCELQGDTTYERPDRVDGTIESEFDGVTLTETMPKCTLSKKNSGLVLGIISSKLRQLTGLWIF